MRRLKLRPPDISKLLFFLFLIFLPQQFGPHFWPPFAFVFGVRLDYLSPTFYVSDLLIIILFFFSWGEVFFNKSVRAFLKSRKFLLFIFVIFIPLLYTASPQALIFGVIKFFEFLYLAFYVVSQIKKKDIPTVIEVFAFAGLFESLLAIAQFFKQESVGGLLYFLGERTYHLSTIGIAAMNTSSGLIVRPYGTFPHPNILAFYLFTTIVFLTYLLKNIKGRISRNNFNFNRVFLVLAFSFCQVALLLTFSRIILFCDIIFLLYVFLYPSFIEKKISRKKITLTTLGFTGIIVYFLFFNLRFFDTRYLMKDILPRQDLIQISFLEIKSFPLFGVGLNNFYFYEAALQKNFSSVYLQPVHNIFLYWIASTGLIGGGIFLYFIGVILVKLIQAINKTSETFSLSADEAGFQKVLLVLLLSIFFVGLFDHFFLTTQQGQLLFALILGLSFSRIL